MERVLSAAGTTAATVALAIGVASPAAVAATAPVALAAPAAAPTKEQQPSAIKISGKDLATPLVVQSKTQPEAFRSLLSQFGWLSTAAPQTTAPAADRLGPKYTVVVLVKDDEQQVYDVYPLAAGGPRAHRPQKQPGGKTTAGWFYGRLTMSEAMRLGGVPLPPKPDVISGGIGGGMRVDVAEAAEVAGPRVDAILSELRQLVLLNAVVAVLITAGLGAIAYLLRRRV
ncbi:MAG TPA: hypothetical protein VFO77_07115 [Actinoplanes sp.]|nr:hypothetical protein [Actinoplanes sp.]